jgi:hypothetical protein
MRMRRTSYVLAVDLGAEHLSGAPGAAVRSGYARVRRSLPKAVIETCARLPEFAITRRRKLHHLSRYSDNAGLVYGGSPRSESLLKCHLPLTDPVGFLNSRAGTCVRNPPHVRERQIVHRTVDLLLRSQTRAV